MNELKNNGLGFKFFIVIIFLLSSVVGGLIGYLYTDISYEEVFVEDNEYSRFDQSIDEMNLAVRQNDELIKQYKDLSSDVDSLKSTYDANDLIRSSINKYELILGEKDSVGSGILLTIEIDLAQYWIVDILNELYDLGAEVVALNDILITPKSSIQYENSSNEMFINDKRIESPYVFKIIGNPNILLKGLTSRAGLIESMKGSFPTKVNLINIEISDNIILKANNRQ